MVDFSSYAVRMIDTEDFEKQNWIEALLHYSRLRTGVEGHFMFYIL